VSWNGNVLCLGFIGGGDCICVAPLERQIFHFVVYLDDGN
jgi:hypothetical protein